jgi:polysaccharide chain length determinant protein (PEP-CTERM system associated)
MEAETGLGERKLMAQRELIPADYIAMLRRRWILILVLTVIGPPLAYGVSRFLPSRYVSQTLVLVQPPSVSQAIVPQVDTTDVSQELASMRQQVTSRTRLEPIIHQFDLYPSDINKVSMETLVARLQSAIEVTPVQAMAETRANGLPGFTVAVTLDTAQHAQQVCAAITSMFIEEHDKHRQQHSEDTTQFLSEQLTEAKANLDAQDGKLAEFKSRYIGSLPEQEQSNLNILTNLTAQLDAATQALARAQQDKSFTESMLTQQLATLQASQTGRDPNTLEQQLAALQTQLATLQARYTDDYPDVTKTKNDIAALKKTIAESDDPKAAAPDKSSKATIEPLAITQLRATVHSNEQIITEKTKEQDQIKEQIKQYQGRIQSSPGVEQQYKELTRGYQTALDSYNELLKNRDASEMGAALQRKQEGEQFTVLDPANLPEKPSFPNRPLFAIGGLVGGFGLGIGLTLFFEMQDSSIRTERDVEFALRLPVLAIVPAIEPASVSKTKLSDAQQSSGLHMEIGARS